VKWSYETVQTRYKESLNSTSNIDPVHKDLFDQLRHVRSELESYKKLEDTLKACICELMGESDTAVMNGYTVATWKTQVRDTFDTKAFKEAHPELASQFTKQTTTRTFLLKGESK
jgi:predicted phage-related endonuclease